MAGIEPPNFLREIAALWREQTSDENTSVETRSALNAWLNESPEQSAAYRSIEQTWSILHSIASDKAILELRQDTARRIARKASSTHRPLRWAVAALVILSVGITLWIALPRAGLDLFPLSWLKGESNNPVAKSYATKTGGRLTVAFEDGSRLTLNTDTDLDVTFTRKARTVRLVHGQALFEVAKDASRPFVVQTADRRFIAVGTTFDVRLDGRQIRVTMLEGTVRAEGGEDSKLRTTVTAGEQLIATERAVDQVRRINPEHETSWRRGQVIFDNTPLSDAIAELNRYSSTHIELADSKLAGLRLSGTFATGSTSTFVEAITAYFPIRIEHTGEHAVTLKARE